MALHTIRLHNLCVEKTRGEDAGADQGPDLDADAGSSVNEEAANLRPCNLALS